MSLKYEYDATGVFFNYFLLAIVGVWLIPTSIGYWNLFKRSRSHHHRTLVTYDVYASVEEKTRRTLKNPRISKRFVFWVLAWIALVVLVKRILQAPDELPSETFWDPYQILGLDTSVTPAEIRKQYRKLSLQWHPDKAEDKELAEKMFVDISKAYKTLTDDDTRRNWEEYGNPDGRQSFSFGIALPSWIVDPSNKAFVLAIYGVLFGFILPLVVSSWWTKSKKFTKDGVMTYSMGLFVRELKEGFNAKRMVELLSASVEFKEEVPWRGQRDSQAVQELFKHVREAVQEKTGERIELPKKFNAPYCVKAFTILYAHLFRVPIADPLLKEDACVIIPKALHLSLRGLLQIATAHSWLQQSIACLEVSRMLLQAIPNAWNISDNLDLAQLPHLEAAELRKIKSRKKSPKSVVQFMESSAEDRGALLEDVGFSKGQMADIITVGSKIPKVTIESATFKCIGEEQITPGCLVTFVLKLGAVYLDDNDVKSKKANGGSTPSGSTDDLSDDSGSDDDDDGDANDGKPRKRSSRLTKLISGTYWMNPNEPAHCPYFPQFNEDTAKRPCYYAFLCNPRNNRMIGAPIQINNLVPKSVTTGSKGYRTAKFRFYCPPQPGTYTFTVIVQCDTYYGIDLRQEVKLVVAPPNQEEEERRSKLENDAWKDFEQEDREERDKMAQMNANLWGGSVGQAQGAEGDSSDDSSDSSDDDSD